MSRVAQIKHLRRVPIDGVLQEVLVMKEDVTNGDLYFIKVQHLDRIDKDRFLRVLKRRDANRYELWDLLSQVTLPNGQNALVLYHQLVRVLHANGKTSMPGHGFGIGSTGPTSLSKELYGQEAAVPEAAKTVKAK